MYNNVTLLGNVGKITLHSDTMLKFSLATSDNYKDKDTNEWVNKTQWHNCVYFGKYAAKLAETIKVGETVLVGGKIEYTKHEEKYFTNIIVKDIKRTRKTKDDRQDGDSEEATANTTNTLPEPPVKEVETDDLPF
ncbi:single-stranded DNA-binding protein [Candidatus Dojkabacteria bacterium]|jgi:single-strand DNA-binding protein|nr:single-stranded DNA-binding protein [Candidatus Dojkabacteria bacterium]